MVMQVEGLTKTYGDVTAVKDLDFTVRPGFVTGFLGPNGAGKSTTMRVLMGLDRPTSGRALIGGRLFADHAAPLRVAGALLDTEFFHPGRSPRTHLRAMSLTHSIPRSRVGEVLDQVGLAGAGGKRAGGFSLGMRQRFGLATALLGDPGTLILDEPFNGLDPEGIRWLRALLRELADEGRTVLVSSHLLAEMAETADRVLVIGRGRMIADTTMEEFTGRSRVYRVTSSDAALLARVLGEKGGDASRVGEESLDVSGVERDVIELTALEQAIELFDVLPQGRSLEETFVQLTQESVEYRSSERGGSR